MYTPIASARIKPPTLPAWLRLVREPLSAAERRALATQHGKLGDAGDVAGLLCDRALAENVECIYVIALNSKMRPIAIEEVARGSLVSAATTPREVFRLAVVLGAFAVILAHNHPSGDPRPSTEDVELTRRVVASGEVLGIHVLDHVILGGADRFFGFRDHGVLGAP
jgi:DNA repair protein RadC